jgi:hypothetical protein
MPLPTSGPISASMINEELGNSAIASISFETIAAEYNFSGPNYGDSNPGLGLDELYGLNPAAGDFLFSDAYGDVNDTGWTFNNAGGVFNTPSPDEGTNSSITFNGASGNTYPSVFTSTTRDADIVVTIPEFDQFSQTYNNYGGTVSGTVFAIQGAYQLQPSDVSSDISSVNSQTGVVTINAGNDASGPGSVTQNFTFSNPNTTTNLPAGQIGQAATQFNVLTGNTRALKSTTISIGVPSGAPDGVSGNQYGNVGSTLTKNTSSVYQYASASIEAGKATSVVTETAPGLGFISFDYDADTYQEGKALDIDIITGYNTNANPMPWQMFLYSGSKVTPGGSELGLSSTQKFYIDNGTNPMGGMGLAGTGATGSNNTNIKVYPVATNSTGGIFHRYIKLTTTGNGSSPGGVYYINLNHNPNITFSVNPTTLSQFTAGAQSKTVVLTTGLSWTATISGTGFSFLGGSSGTGTTTFTISAAANTGGLRTGVFTLDAVGFSGFTKTFNFSQAADPVNSTVWMEHTGTWKTYGTALSPTSLPLVIQQSSSSPYGFTPNFIEFGLQSDYAQNYGISLDSVTYLSIGTSNTGGAQQTTSTSVTSTPSSAQLYIRNDYNPGQYANTVFRDTVFTITNSDLSSHSFTIRLQGSGTSTPPSPPSPPSPPPGGPGCLIYGTQVSMIDGTTKEIQNLVIGDIVKSINIDTMADGESESLNWSSDTLTYTSAQSEVIATTEYSVDTIYSFNTGLIEASKEHNHFIKRNNTHMFLRSDNIQVGDYFLNDENVFIEITSIEQNSDSNNFVYKIDVETKDLFFGNGILTHNAKGVGEGE